MKLSKILIEYRQSLQISQRELARRCGLSNSYISFIENEFNPRTGKPIVPTIEQYQNLAAGMGLTVQQLFEQLDEDSPVDLRVSVLPDDLSETEQRLISAYRLASDEIRDAALAMLESSAEKAQKTPASGSAI